MLLENELIFLVFMIIGVLVRSLMIRFKSQVETVLSKYARQIVFTTVIFIVIALTLPITLEIIDSELRMPFREPPWYYSVYVTYTIGLIAGFLLVDSLRMDDSGGWVFALTRRLPFAVVFLIGILGPNLRDFGNGFRSVTAGPIQIELSEERIQTHQNPEISNTTQDIVRYRGPSFLTGLQIYRPILQRISADRHRFRYWCGRYPLFDCPGFREFGNPATGEEPDDSELTSELSDALILHKALMPFNECLVAYSDYFPRALPLRGVLTSIAINVTLPDLDRELLKTQLEKLTRDLGTAAKYMEKHGGSPGACRDTERSALAQIIDKLKVPNQNLPYTSILEASILAMADLPQAALDHLRREYRAFRSQQARSYYNISEHDFVDYVLRMRFLLALDWLAYSNDQHFEQIHYVRDSLHQIEGFLTRAMRLSSRGWPTAFPRAAMNYGSVLRSCATMELINPKLVSEQNSFDMHRLLRDAEIKKMHRFMAGAVLTYLFQTYRLLDAYGLNSHHGRASLSNQVKVSANDSAVAINLAPDEIIRRAETLVKVYSGDGFDDLHKCLWLFSNHESWVESSVVTHRFLSTALYGLVLNRKTATPERDPERNIRVDRDEQREAYCKARIALSRANRIANEYWDAGQKTEIAESLRSDHSELLIYVREAIRKMDASSLECGGRR